MTVTFFLWIFSSYLLAQDNKGICQGPVSCNENIDLNFGVFFNELGSGNLGDKQILTESELKEVEQGIGLSQSQDLLNFNQKYFEKNGEDAPLPVTRAFQKFRQKLNVDDRNMDFVNLNENKSLGLEGPESHPKDIVNVKLPDPTKATLRPMKIKSNQPESN